MTTTGRIIGTVLVMAVLIVGALLAANTYLVEAWTR